MKRNSAKHVRSVSDCASEVRRSRWIHRYAAAILIAALLATTGLQSTAEDLQQVTPSLSDALQAALDQTFSAFNVMGCSAAVLLPCGAMWQGVTGLSHDDLPVASDMLFCVGSVTKNYITPLILQLAEEEALSLDDTVGHWLPTTPNVDPAITIRQLLNQRSGLCNMSDQPELWDAVFEDPTVRWEPERILSEYAGERCGDPGEAWHYSNTGFLVAGMIIEEATGMTVAENLRSRFLEPHALRQTFLSAAEPFPSDVEVCHGWFDLDEDGVAEDVTNLREAISSVLWTSAAVYATAEDVACWIHELFGGAVLESQSLEQMIKAYSVIPGTGGVGYGLSVNIYGDEAIGHSGRTFGYLSLFVYLREQGATIVVLLNGDDAQCLDAVASALTVVVMNLGTAECNP